MIERFQLNFLATGYLQSLLTTLLKNRFPATFGRHLEFLRKSVYLGNGARFLTHRVYWRLFPKIIFPPLLVAIFNFCVKCKYGFISETERDRAISMTFFTHRVSAESTDDFFQK